MTPTQFHEEELLSMALVLAATALDNNRAMIENSIMFRPSTHIDDYVPPAELAGQSLNALEAQIHGFPAPRASEGYGLDAIPEDYAAHRRIVRQLRNCSVRRLSRALVVGEEAGDADWDAVETAPVGTMVVVIDPLDGSSNFDTFGEGFSTNLLVSQKTGQGKQYELLIDVTAASSGGVLIGLHRGGYTSVYCKQGRMAPVGPMTTPLYDDPRQGYVAIVGMAARQRARAEALLSSESDAYWGLPPHRSGGRDYEHPAPFVHTMGGAPATVQLAMRRLSAMVTLEPSTLHDSSGVPALLALGLHAFDANGPVDPRALMNRSTLVDRPYSDNYKPIPPLAIGRDFEFTRKLAERLWNPPMGNGRLRLLKGNP